MTRGASASVFGAAVVSAVLTAAVALPMGANAIDAAGDPAGLHEDIALNDTRFPAAVPLDDNQLEVLERAPETLAAPAAEESEATATEAPIESPAEATPTSAPEDDTEEFAIIFPTPTTEAPPTPRPIPTATPAPPTPTPLAPTPTATAIPQPSPSPDVDEPTPSQVPESTPDPTPEPGDMPSTDVYAYVTGDPLVENEVGSLDVKAINAGGEPTTEVTMTVSTAGATILSVTPQRSNWTCSGGDASWSCRGPDLEAEGWSRGIMSVLPNTSDDVTVSVSVSHGIMDEAPGNNSLQATVPVVPDPDPDPDPDPIGEDGGADDGTADDGGADIGDGGTDGGTDGATDGTADGTTDGTTDGATDGTADGTTDGATDGTADGTTDGDPGSDGGSTPSATPGEEAVVANNPARPTGEAESASRATD